GLYRTLIAEGQAQYRPELARTRMNEGVALGALNRPGDALARYEEAAGLYRTLIAEGQAQYRPELVKTRVNAATVCADRADGLEAAIAHLDHALAVWEDAEATPAVALDPTPRLADLIHRTRSVTGFAARVERLARQVARALGGIAPEHLGSFYPLAERAFTLLLVATLDQKAWDLALTVIGTARARRLAKLAQADLLRRAAREDDPAELREYREAIRRFAELEILLNVGSGPGGEGTAGGRGGERDASQQYKALYDEYTAQRRRLDALEQTLRQRGLLPDLGAGLFDGAGLRNKLPPHAALLVLVDAGGSLPNLVVILTRAGGQAVPMEGGSDWSRRLEGITKTLKDRGRALRDGPEWDTQTANADGDTSELPQESVDVQTQALTEVLAEQFWKPIQGTLGDAVNTVWLLPTGELHGLPWQASAPLEWRCRLAPAPWFVRQALDRVPDPAPLHPTAAAPLGALTYAAPTDIELRHGGKELVHLALEENAIPAIWGEAARPLAGLAPPSSPPAAFIALAGHGASDATIPGAARILVGREGDDPRYVGFGELWNAPLPRLLGLYFSSCVVGRTREVHGEPLGLISAGLLRGAHYLVGWSVPVDDLGAALFALLYHWLWRECADPEEALSRARSAFLTGAWPDAAVERARPLLADHLRRLLAEWIKTDDRQARKKFLRNTLSHLHEDAGEWPGTLANWKQQLDAWWRARNLEAAQAVAEPLAIRILDRRAEFPFRYIGHFALGFGAISPDQSPGR
ncbi:MAG TPA: CHAT domain-containing protein, partial [Candidatus Competibacter sp.]|nr:CHAT domain-containing protein [Candidatus Competibacter sp.]